MNWAGVASSFVVVGDCVARPRGWRRVVLDFLCRFTGHVLWRNLNSVHNEPGGSLPLYGSHCLRCFRFGYVQGDYRHSV